MSRRSAQSLSGLLKAYSRYTINPQTLMSVMDFGRRPTQKTWLRSAEFICAEGVDVAAPLGWRAGLTPPRPPE